MPVIALEAFVTLLVDNCTRYNGINISGDKVVFIVLKS